MLRGIPLILTVMICAGLAPGTGAALTRAQANGPRFFKSACNFDVPADQHVDCGYLVVPEDRSDPNSPLIRLAVAIFRAKAAKSAGDAVLYLDGGPGGHSIETARPSFEAVFSGFAQTRDFIMFDQRGVGFSKPSLDCPEVTKAAYDGLTRQMNFEARTTLENEALKICHDRLIAQGIHLSAYNTAASAADVNDLRKALGYTSFNLYGISYGTRLALTVMRDFPDGIRSVILDSTVPLQADLYGRMPANADRAFQVFFKGCLQDKRCNRAYPNLEKTFYDLVDKLNSRPAAITARQPYSGKPYRLSIDGHHLIQMLFSSLYSSSVIVYLPQVIYTASRGNYSLLASFMAGNLLKQEYVSIGMYYSVQCAEEVSFDTPGILEKADTSFPKFVNSFSIQNYGTVCQTWNVRAAPAVENQPVKSTVYTLVMAGQYDPITPPEYGQMAAQTLNHSNFVQFSGVGHGASVGDPCPYKVAIAFVNNPKVKPQTGCISQMPSPRFVVTP